MRLAIFTGPSLSHAEARAILPDANVLPPAARGDVYRAARMGAEVIALIDGVFEMVPAVMHKEVLWVLSEGIDVYGASSIGALRAAELHSFGMIGHGKIYEAYRDGQIDADDEVAVLMGPAELGYPALTEPMVNIRATLALAVEQGVIPQSSADALIAIGRSMFFKERTFSALFDQSRSVVDIGDLETWLPDGRVDQKRADAIDLLRRISGDRTSGDGGHRPTFQFVATSIWLQVKQRIDRELKMEQDGAPAG
ncbi:MAG: TfuA-like protein [Hyphomicrobiaceae bacterium]